MSRMSKDKPMKGLTKPVSMTAKSRTLGDRTFAAITAVEGLSLSKASSKRLTGMRQRKLSPGEQRAEVIRAYMSSK
jgi:hypothetical protein